MWQGKWTYARAANWMQRKVCLTFCTDISCTDISWSQIPAFIRKVLSFCYKVDIFHVGVLLPSFKKKRGGSHCPSCICYFFLSIFSSKHILCQSGIIFWSVIFSPLWQYEGSWHREKLINAVATGWSQWWWWWLW
jgi:hypothetical protein